MKRSQLAPTTRTRFPHAPIVQLNASLNLLCPSCGKIGTYRIDYTQWKLRCKNSACRKFWGLGLTLYELDSHAHGRRGTVRPPDTVMPAVEVGEWSSGEPVHRVVEFKGPSRAAKS